MVSVTKITKRRRKSKRTAAGQSRKRVLRSKGSTPKFAIHPDKQ